MAVIGCLSSNRRRGAAHKIAAEVFHVVIIRCPFIKWCHTSAEWQISATLFQRKAAG